MRRPPFIRDGALLTLVGFLIPLACQYVVHCVPLRCGHPITMQIRLFARVISGYTAINNDKCGPGATLHPKMELRGGVILPKLGEIAHTRVCVTYAISDTSGP